jgi:anthranilate synthase component 2/putative glutamine amidotransferase
VVGVTTYAVVADWANWPQRSALTPLAYTDRLLAAGASPVLLPVGERAAPGQIGEALARLDGLVLIGGEDVCGRFYGRDEDPREHEEHRHRPERDASEIEAVKVAWEHELPILAICRGLQVLNVALGGTLVPDLAEAGALPDHRIQRGVFHHHDIAIEPGTVLHGLYGDEASVPSHHHQAVERLAPDLRVTARSGDGVIEGVEGRNGTFAVGVQWHPEEGAETVLFEAFVEACRARS